MSNPQASWRRDHRIAHQNFLANRKPQRVPLRTSLMWEDDFEKAVEQRGQAARAAFYLAHPDLEQDNVYAA